jgi:uncharacterized membrane protein
LVIHPRVRKAVTRIAVLTGLAVLAGPGPALAACPAQALSTPFSQWDDGHSYFPVPGGSFEGSAEQVGWSLSGASLSPGNEPFSADGSADAQSLRIDGGGSATSPYFCVDSTMSSLRFFAQQLAAGSDLEVTALVRTRYGVLAVPVAELADGSMPAWAPTQPFGGETRALGDDCVMAALRFSVPASAGSWQVDDVYIDPYRSG